MAIIAPLFAFVGRFVGRFLNMAFGWASTMLFGRVPQSKQLLLSLISLGSIVWVATLIGVIFPDVGTFLVAAIPAPDFVQEGWIRLAMLIAALVLPLLIGVGGLFMLDAADRPKGVGMVIQVLRGYPYAAVLALTLLMLIVVAPIRKVRSLIKRWEDAHIPMIVKPGGYERVADDLEHAVDAAGLELQRTGAPRILEAPSKLLALVGGAGVKRLVPDRLIVLKGKELEVMIHPSDVAVSGKKSAMARARAALASRLTFTAAYLTTSKESQEVEDRLEKTSGLIRKATDGRRPSRDAVDEVRKALDEVDRVLSSLEVPYDEWEVLYRQRLQVERDLLSAQHEEGDGRADGGPVEKVVDAVKSLVR